MPSRCLIADRTPSPTTCGTRQTGGSGQHLASRSHRHAAWSYYPDWEKYGGDGGSVLTIASVQNSLDQGSGIDLVQVWLDSPPNGTLLGTAELGFSDANATLFGAQFTN
jgi:hypothetical protein